MKTAQSLIPAAKPALPARIRTVDQAKTFMKTLNRFGWLMHPDQDAHKIQFSGQNRPDKSERNRLNMLMDDISLLEDPGFSAANYYQELTGGGESK